MKRFSYLVTMLTLAMLAASCQPHDPFCLSHLHGAKVRIDVDWSEFKEEKPDGMTLFLYPSDSTGQNIQYTTHTITHATFSLMPDSYMIMVQNQSAAEFGTVVFRDMDDYTTAWVQPERCSSSWYRPAEGEILVHNPEWLAFDRQEAEVTPEMVEGEVEWHGDHTTRAEDEKETLIATMVPQNVVYTLHVSVKVKGINNFRSGRAMVSGMADGYFIGAEKYHSDKVAHLLDTWKVKDKTVGADKVQVGTLTSEITCFGLPDGHGGKAAENIFRLSLLLVDNETRVNRMFNVGSRIYQRTTNGSPLHLYLDLELSDKLPDVAPALGSDENGFDAEVDDWGDETNQDIPM